MEVIIEVQSGSPLIQWYFGHMICGTSCEDSLVSRDNRNRGSRFNVLPLAQAISLYTCHWPRVKPVGGREDGGGGGRGVKEGGMEGVGKGGEGGRE